MLADAVAPLHREFPESHRRSARRRCRSGDPRRRGLRQANWTPDQDREAAVQGSVSSAACSSTVSVAFSCSVGRLAVLPQDPLDQYPALAPATFSRMLQAMMAFRRTADTQPARDHPQCVVAEHLAGAVVRLQPVVEVLKSAITRPTTALAYIETRRGRHQFVMRQCAGLIGKGFAFVSLADADRLKAAAEARPSRRRPQSRHAEPQKAKK